MNTATLQAAGAAFRTMPPRLSNDPYTGRFVIIIVGAAALAPRQEAARTDQHCRERSFAKWRSPSMVHHNGFGSKPQTRIINPDAHVEPFGLVERDLRQAGPRALNFALEVGSHIREYAQP
jgi:hypothetical protein